MQLRTFFIGLAALLMAVVGAYFSIQGLSVLFSGAKTQVMIMTGVLEFSKLVTASFVYLYWKELKWFFKSFLITAVTVLIVITSIGIYGYLTSAFQFSSEELQLLDRQIQNIEQRKDRLQVQIDGDITERGGLISTINSLTEGLSGNVIQYIDQETGQLVTTTSSATRNVLTQQLNQANERRDFLSNRIEAFTDSITILDSQILEIRSGSDVVRELGPLQFISDVSGYSMSSVVSVLALVITITYDPLAVSLVIAFNLSYGFSRRRKKGEPSYHEWYELYGEKKPVLTNDKSKPNTNVVETIKNVPESNLVGETIDNDKDEDHETKNQDDIPKSIENIDMETDNPVVPPKMKPVIEQPVKLIPSPTVREQEPLDIPSLKDVPEKPKDTTDDVKKQVGRVPVYMDSEKTELVGYDTDGDGAIDVPTHSMANRYSKTKKPYYARPDFDWNDKSKWINDQAAVNYWLTNVWSKDTYSKYPTDFDSKTY